MKAVDIGTATSGKPGSPIVGAAERRPFLLFACLRFERRVRPEVRPGVHFRKTIKGCAQVGRYRRLVLVQSETQPLANLMADGSGMRCLQLRRRCHHGATSDQSKGSENQHFGKEHCTQGGNGGDRLYKRQMHGSPRSLPKPRHKNSHLLSWFRFGPPFSGYVELGFVLQRSPNQHAPYAFRDNGPSDDSKAPCPSRTARRRGQAPHFSSGRPHRQPQKARPRHRGRR